MNRIRAVILTISIALLPSMAVAEEPAKKSDKDWVHGWVAEDEYLEKKREKEGKKGIMIRDFELYAAGAGIVTVLARIFHELVSRDHADGRATWQPQGFGSEAYLNGTSQGPKPEDARKDGLIRGRSK